MTDKKERKIIRGTGLRVLERVVTDGDTITDSILIAHESNTPICIGIKGLVFKRCMFGRCVPPEDATQINCRENQTALPPEPEPEEMFTVFHDQLVEIVKAARDGKPTDVDEFCRQVGLTLPSRVIPEVFK